MADIVVGIGTSHGPLLNTPPAEWGQRASADRRDPRLVYRGEEFTFEELVSARGVDFSAECAPEVWRRRHAACRAAITEVGAVLGTTELDALVVVSSDHKEVFTDELLAPFSFYWGDSVPHVPFTAEALDGMAPGLAIAEVANVPDEPTVRPCHSELAAHLIRMASAAGFDPAASRTLPPGRYGDGGIPHGWGFIYQQVLGGTTSIPVVPVFVNTFWEPNPPSAMRCYDFGRALGAAIRSFPGNARVGVVASGGLSHMVVDEELDRGFLDSLMTRDPLYPTRLSPEVLRSGSSELRNWIVVAGALADTDLQPRLIDYQPCYRSEAGTGCAMGFVAWERPAAMGETR
jgi:Catalytic LigB subunit of aromatic ring-opening dioxygenase